MTLKSAISTSLITPVDVTVNSAIPIGDVIHEFGCGVSHNTSSLVLGGIGYYNISAEFTVTPSAAGTVTITMYEDGIPTASKAMSTAVADASVNMSLNALVKLHCCKLTKRISFVLTGVDSTIESADIVAIKL